MKKSSWVTLMFATLGCNSESPVSSQFVKPGEYTGVFSLTINAGTDSATVLSNTTTFTFADSGWYTCRGANILNPPTGGGPYRIEEDSIYLTDQSPHLAFFDWTLILGGSFYFQSRSDSLILTQNDIQHNRYRYISLATKPK